MNSTFFTLDVPKDLNCTILTSFHHSLYSPWIAYFASLRLTLLIDPWSGSHLLRYHIQVIEFGNDYLGFTSNMNPFPLKGEGGENTCKLSYSGVNNSTPKTGELWVQRKVDITLKSVTWSPSFPHILQTFLYKIGNSRYFEKVQVEVPICTPNL